MTNAALLGMILLTSGFAQAQEFEVATIKPTAPDWNGGRYMRMKSANQFEAKNYTLKVLLSAAYNLSAPEILGGPDWVDSDRYDILGKTPGDARPTPDQQMAMLRKLIADRFDLAFHGERRETSIYSLTVAKNGPKLTESKAPPDTPAERRPLLAFVISPQGARMPGRDASMAELATVLQRSIDHPVVDQTGLSGRYDFDLEFLPDDTQFNGALRDVIKPEVAYRYDLFAALQQQLGMKLEAKKGPVEALVIDRARRPSEN
jgi:uncharacterized protein (TIGR03435 family)